MYFVYGHTAFYGIYLTGNDTSERVYLLVSFLNVIF